MNLNSVKYIMQEKSIKVFFATLFITTLLPYLPFVFPFMPDQLFGFNMTGWAWISMLMITLIYLIQNKRITFPILVWLPWIIYIVFYLIIDFSFLGLQLTLQYILPIIVGCIASTFVYSKRMMYWLFKYLVWLSIIIFVMFVIGKLTSGYGPAMAATAMFLSVTACITIGIYFITKKTKYFWAFIVLFIVPFLSITRTGIASFIVIFVLHFANKKISNKLIYGLLGAVLAVFVFNSDAFQEKMFKEGKGTINDLSLNYYDNVNINSSGRTSLQLILEPGLKKSPIWGNGPRSDNFAIKGLFDESVGEAHNDYLSVRYNYGYVGLSFLLFGFAVNFLLILRRIRYNRNVFAWLIGTSVLTLFFSFLMFMYSDNILKYTIYFPNYFFAMIGIYFSLLKNRGLISMLKRKAPKIVSE